VLDATIWLILNTFPLEAALGRSTKADVPPGVRNVVLPEAVVAAKRFGFAI
jgi:hypothetical protein